MSSTPPIPVISSASIKNIDVVTATVITHVFVHVISVLGVIDALFAAVEYALSNKSACSYFIQCKRHLFITVLILVSVLDYKYNSK